MSDLQHEDDSREGSQEREDAGEDGAASGFVPPSRPAAAAPATDRVVSVRSFGRQDGYSSACLRRALGRAGPSTQHIVYSNQPSIHRHSRNGGHRASRRQEAASSLGSRRGTTAVRTTLRLALSARDRELRVERARSDTLAAQHATHWPVP